jgi:hypothetical protein
VREGGRGKGGRGRGRETGRGRKRRERERQREREGTCRYSVYLLLIRILKSLLGMIFLVLIPFC